MNEERNKHMGNKLAGVHGMSHLNNCNERNPFHGSISVYSSHKCSLLWILVETVLYDRA